MKTCSFALKSSSSAVELNPFSSLFLDIFSSQLGRCSVWAGLYCIPLPRKMATASKPQNRSIVEYLGCDGGHRCGYCKGSSGFVAPGMWAHQLTVQHLQVMLPFISLKYSYYIVHGISSKMTKREISFLLYTHIHVVMSHINFELIHIKIKFFMNF